MAKTADERTAAEAHVYAELKKDYHALISAAEEVRMLHEKALPEAKSAVDQITDGYASGRFSQLDVLDAQKTYNETRTQYVRALSDFHKAKVEIDALTAGPVELPRSLEPGSRAYRRKQNTNSPRDD